MSSHVQVFAWQGKSTYTEGKRKLVGRSIVNERAPGSWLADLLPGIFFLPVGLCYPHRVWELLSLDSTWGFCLFLHFPLSYFFNLFFNWRKITMLYWFQPYNNMSQPCYAYITFLLSLLPPLPHTSLLGHHRAPGCDGLLALCSSSLPAVWLHMSVLFSPFVPLLPSPTVSTSPSSLSASSFHPCK